MKNWDPPPTSIFTVVGRLENWALSCHCKGWPQNSYKQLRCTENTHYHILRIEILAVIIGLSSLVTHTFNCSHKTHYHKSRIDIWSAKQKGVVETFTWVAADKCGRFRVVDISILENWEYNENDPNLNSELSIKFPQGPNVLKFCQKIAPLSSIKRV